MKIVKLSEICTFSRGLTYSKSDEVDFSNNVVLRANNIDLESNSLNLEDLRYIKDSIKIKKEKIAKKNSLIICTASGSKSHVGKVALIDENYGYAFGGFMGQLTPTDKCLPKFLYFILTSGLFKDFLMSLNDGTNINNLKFSDIENYEVLLPSLEKQSEIIEKLDSTFAELDSLETKLALGAKAANELFRSILSLELTCSESESWHEVSLKEICDVDWGNTNLTKSSYVDGGTYLAVSAAGADGFIDHFEHEADVPVLSAIGAQCGRMFFPGARFTAIKNTITLTPKNGVTVGKFLYYLFTYVDLPQRGAGQPFISKGDIEVFKVRIPKSLETQREIVEKLDGAFSEIELLRRQLKLQKDFAGALRQSLLSSSLKEEMEVA
jgi:restriction endonuclease S subunit